MDVQFNAGLNRTQARAQQRLKREEWSVLAYWAISCVLGVVFLRDWIMNWNVGATLSHFWLVGYLVLTWALSQSLYLIIARHGNRPISLSSVLAFTIGNGIAEVFAFGVAYRLGEMFGYWAVDAFAPAAASIAGLVVGVLFFMVYGGLIHALFWLRLLPPHLDDAPLSVAIRKYRPLAEVGLVIGWSLCFWLTQDIWTVVFLHILLDLGMALRVRPLLFHGKGAHA